MHRSFDKKLKYRGSMLQLVTFARELSDVGWGWGYNATPEEVAQWMTAAPEWAFLFMRVSETYHKVRNLGMQGAIISDREVYEARVCGAHKPASMLYEKLAPIAARLTIRPVMIRIDNKDYKAREDT
jgi:hypothetical protein